MTDNNTATESTAGARLQGKAVILTGAAGNIGTFILARIYRGNAVTV